MYDLLKLKWEDAVTYDQYMGSFDKRLHNPDSKGFSYLKLNQSRSQRWMKKIQIETAIAEQLAALKKEYLFLVISEPWCGDAAHALPVIKKMADLSPKIQLGLVFRDEHLDLMNQYLTEGSQSIPKLIVIEACEFREVAVWGPRPKAAQMLLKEFKTGEDWNKEAFQKELQAWYNNNQGKQIQEELIGLLHHVENKVGSPCE